MFAGSPWTLGGRAPAGDRRALPPGAAAPPAAVCLTRSTRRRSGYVLGAPDRAVDSSAECRRCRAAPAPVLRACERRVRLLTVR